MVTRNLWRRISRTVLTVAGIAIGITVVVMLPIVADGISGQLSAIMASSGAEITVMLAEVADISLSIRPESMGHRLIPAHWI